MLYNQEREGGFSMPKPCENRKKSRQVPGKASRRAEDSAPSGEES